MNSNHTGGTATKTCCGKIKGDKGEKHIGNHTNYNSRLRALGFSCRCLVL